MPLNNTYRGRTSILPLYYYSNYCGGSTYVAPTPTVIVWHEWCF